MKWRVVKAEASGPWRERYRIPGFDSHGLFWL
jgi:hypothetical protein